MPVFNIGVTSSCACSELVPCLLFLSAVLHVRLFISCSDCHLLHMTTVVMWRRMKEYYYCKIRRDCSFQWDLVEASSWTSGWEAVPAGIEGVTPHRGNHLVSEHHRHMSLTDLLHQPPVTFYVLFPVRILCVYSACACRDTRRGVPMSSPGRWWKCLICQATV